MAAFQRRNAKDFFSFFPFLVPPQLTASPLPLPLPLLLAAQPPLACAIRSPPLPLVRQPALPLPVWACHPGRQHTVDDDTCILAATRRATSRFIGDGADATAPTCGVGCRGLGAGLLAACCVRALLGWHASSPMTHGRADRKQRLAWLG